MFDAVLPVRDLGGAAQSIADRLFFETVVRVHRAGENAPYTGLKPAGLDVGPVIPLAEQAAVGLDAEALADFLSAELRDRLDARVAEIGTLAAARSRSLADERRYVEAVLGLQVYSHRLYRQMHAERGH